MRIKFPFILFVVFLVSCSVLKSESDKNWSENQVKEFLSNCETNAKKMLSDKEAVSYCKCAINKVAKAYPDYSIMKKTPIKEVLKLAEDCRD